MRHDAWDYLLALGRHWVVLLTGSLLATAVTWGPLLLKVQTPRVLAWIAFTLVIPIAGFFAWREERNKAVPRTVNARLLDDLTAFRQEGANLYAKKLGLPGQLPIWGHDVNTWREKVAKYLEANVSKSARGQFEVLGAFLSADVAGSLNSEHGDARLMLSEHLKRLERIIERMS